MMQQRAWAVLSGGLVALGAPAAMAQQVLPKLVHIRIVPHNEQGRESEIIGGAGDGGLTPDPVRSMEMFGAWAREAVRAGRVPSRLEMGGPILADDLLRGGDAAIAPPPASVPGPGAAVVLAAGIAVVRRRRR